MSVFAPPDILVLAAGGVLGEAWMTGVLAGIEDATGADLRRTDAFVGTSAGSIVAARLAAGRSPRRPAEGAPAAAPARRWATTTRRRRRPGPARRPADGRGGRLGGHRARGVGGADARRAGRGARARRRRSPACRAGTGRSTSSARASRAGAPRFDGRLRVCAVDRRSGGASCSARPARPAAEVADAVVASCSIPWVFEPVAIGGREYVDGGVWSVTNLDAAPAGRDTHVLCLDVLSGLDPGSRGMTAMRRAFRVAAELETQLLRRRGAHVLRIGPDRAAADVLGPDLMDPGPRDAALAAGFRQGAALAGG